MFTEAIIYDCLHIFISTYIGTPLALALAHRTRPATDTR